MNPRFPVVLAGLLALSSCDRTSSWMPSDIDRDETLSAIGAAGYQRVCDAFEDHVRDEYASSYLTQAVCLAYAIENSADAVQCGDAVQSCTETLPPAAESLLNSILAQASCSAVEAEPTGCAATVSQLKACLDALDSELGSLQFGLTCAAAGEPVPEDWWRIPLPQACSALRADCAP